MHDATRRAARVEASIPTASVVTATMIRFDGAMCVVRDHLGIEQTWRWAGTVVPAPGDSVQVQVVDGVHLVMGRTVPTPTQGTVAAVSSTTLLIDVSVGPSPIEAAFIYADPQVGDIVALTHGFEGFLATGKSSFTPLPVEVETGTPGAGGSGRQSFRAVEAGNWRHGSWISGRPTVSETRTAGWHYGPSLAATLPDTAVITGARMFLPTVQELYGNPLAQAFDGPPPASGGVGPQIQLPAQSGWVDLPVPVAEQLRTGNRGIKLIEIPATGPWSIWKSLSEDPLSGALDISWKA